MGIPQKINTTVTIRARNIDFTQCEKITVDLKQPTFLKSYEAAVLDAERIAFEIPAKDAARLNLSYPVKWQILARDALGDRWTRAKTCTVEEVLHGGVWE